MNWSIEFPSLHSDEGPARSCISFGHHGHVRGMSGAHEESHAPRVSSCFFLWTGKRSPDDFLTIDGFFFGFWTINRRWWMSLLFGYFWGDPMFHALYISNCSSIVSHLGDWSYSFTRYDLTNRLASYVEKNMFHSAQLENPWRASGQTMQWSYELLDS